MTTGDDKPKPPADEALRDQLQRQFTLAEGEVDASRSEAAFRRIGRQSRERSVQRHERRIEATRQRLDRSRRLQGLLLLILLLLVLASIGYYLFSTRPVEVDDVPEQMSTWIKQQRLLEQLRKVQEWLADGSAQSAEDAPQTIEELQAWLDQIKLNPQLQSPTQGQGAGGSGFVPFQCPQLPIECTEEDVPAGDGDYRIELSRLVRNANIMLADNGDCEGTVHLIGEYGSLFGWRRTEAQTKARTELSVARCFMDKNDHDNAQLHYRRTFCASISDPTPDQAMNALYGLARIAYRNAEMGVVESRIDCSESLLDYHLQSTTTVETLHHYISLALMHYEFLNDSDEAIRLQEKALNRARAMMSQADPEDIHSYHNLLLTLQLNLMEGYITINETGKLSDLHDEVNLNPLLQDTDSLIARGMLVMQSLIEGDNDRAKRNLALIIQRYRTLAEFTTFWSWDAFDRWQSDTRAERSEELDSQITMLRQALAPPLSNQSLQMLMQVQSSITGGR